MWCPWRRIVCSLVSSSEVSENSSGFWRPGREKERQEGEREGGKEGGREGRQEGEDGAISFSTRLNAH